jgi:hypothetical protein
MDALELALKCSSLLMRSMSTRSTNLVGTEQAGPAGSAASTPSASATTPTAHTPGELPWNESDFEKHYKDHGEGLIFSPFFRNVHLEDIRKRKSQIQGDKDE